MTGRDPGDYVIYQCDPGYLFPDGASAKSSICIGNGKWSSVMTSCQAQKVKQLEHFDVNGTTITEK